ncbi:MAG: hypothetical protein SH868_01455 [Bythopirellula sp.]|nr:hypothetical protein [Bythopirellula sp.]
MNFHARNSRFVLALLCCALLTCSFAPVLGDFEIESFTRYRVTNMDNNNNNYVDDFDITDPSYQVEKYAVAEGLEQGASQELYLYYGRQLEISTAEGTTGSVHVQYRIPGPFLSGSNGFLDNNTISNGLTVVDYDDLHTFNIGFERTNGYSYMQSRSVQLERVLRFSSQRTDQPVEPNAIAHVWEVSYGARFYQLDDFYGFLGTGGILGRTAFDTLVDNQHAGPHLGFLWNVSQGPWSLGLSGLLQGGLGETDSNQSGFFGEDLNPGAVNSPIYAEPHLVSDRAEDQFGSLYSEVRAQVSRTLTEQLSLNLGCSGYYFSDLKYADNSINWFIPDLGLADNGTEETIVTTAFASLEFRR